jgi:acyl-CoA synthetase (AMP-forming)/AMP-acid ligase II
VAALETLAPRLVVAHPDVADAAHAATEPLGVPIVFMHEGWTAGAAASSPPRVGDSEDPSVVFLTSGSTGVSKGAMISHRARVAVQRDSEPATQRAVRS